MKKYFIIEAPIKNEGEYISAEFDKTKYAKDNNVTLGDNAISAIIKDGSLTLIFEGSLNSNKAYADAKY